MKVRFPLIVILFSVLFFACGDDSGSKIINEEPILTEGEIQVISPFQAISDENFPIVIRVRNEENLTNKNVSKNLHLNLENAFANRDFFSIRKGVGSLMPRIQADSNFTISLENFTGDRTVFLRNEIPQKEYQETLSESQTWTSEFDRVITKNLTIPQNVKLTILEGTRVLLADTVNISVLGEIEVLGTLEKPVHFTSTSWNNAWGGITYHNQNSIANFEYTFFTRGGGHPDKVFGHSFSQAVVYTGDNAESNFSNCFFMDNVGKAFGAEKAKVTISNCLITRCDTGGEFRESLAKISDSHILEMPIDDGKFVDDDNDGFYFYRPHFYSEEYSKVENSVFMIGRDDGIDHNWANLEINNCWIEGFMHEGVACSRGNNAKIFNTVVKGCNQGIEAGYNEPNVTVDHCVIIGNDVGLRFGDSYTWGYFGHMNVTNSIIIDNKDNVLNLDLGSGQPVEGAIEVSFSILKDLDFNDCTNCIEEKPLFDESYFLLPESIGKNAGSDGKDLGLIPN